MRDLMHKLEKKRGNVEITFDDIINDEALNEIESEDADLKDFFQKIEIIKEDIGIIKINITNVDKQQNVILTSTTITTEQETRELLDQTMADISKRSQRTKRLLKEIKEGVEEDQENGDNSSHCRMKRCQFNALSLEFMDNMTRYNAIQELFRAKSKSRIKRQLNITKKTEVSDEELEEMLENKEPINIFTQGIVTDTDDAKRRLKEVEDRHNDIIKLEKSVQELHSLFKDISILIDKQGDLIDHIETNVENATEYIASAIPKIHAAVRYKNKANRKKIMLFGVVGSIILIIILVVVMKYAR
eukprot:TCONS_00051050-protein